jgi:uncharacterized membrane protein
MGLLASFIPFLFAVYLTCVNEYYLAVVCFLISSIGFRQVAIEKPKKKKKIHKTQRVDRSLRHQQERFTWN